MDRGKQDYYIINLNNYKLTDHKDNLIYGTFVQDTRILPLLANPRQLYPRLTPVELKLLNVETGLSREETL